MSLTSFPRGLKPQRPTAPFTKVTMPTLSEMKRLGKPISALTAYDYSMRALSMKRESISCWSAIRLPWSFWGTRTRSP